MLGFALALTLATVGYQRVGPRRTVEGEGFCPGPEPCSVPALGGGLPLAFLVDDPQVSVPHALHLVEDDFRPAAFLADFLFFAALTLGGERLSRRWGGRPTPRP